MRTIAIEIAGTNYRARVLPTEESWEPAALRAVQRRFGKSARVWTWTVDSRQVNRNGDTIRVGYKATVVGKRARRGNSWPVLAEVRLWLAT